MQKTNRTLRLNNSIKQDLITLIKIFLVYLIQSIIILFLLNVLGCGQINNESGTMKNDVTLREMENDLDGFLRSINSNCPLEIDSVTRTDSLTLDSIQNIIVYHNTILLELSPDDSNVLIFKTLSKNQLPIDYMNLDGYAPFRQLKIGVEMRVRDIRGNDLFSVKTP